MHTYKLTHLSDAVLVHALTAIVAQERVTIAVLLAHIAEVDERRLFVPAGYTSMHAYCVEALGLSEDAASKRIQAARAARDFPVLFEALADGRLHLAAVCLLAPHLNPENLDELLAAATHRRKAEIEVFLAQRFGRSEMRAGVDVIRPLPGAPLSPAQVAAPALANFGEHAPGHVDASERLPMFQLRIGKGTHDKLRHAQELLSHAVPSGDIGQVLDRALDALIGKLEKRKWGATARPRADASSGAQSRHVPAHVRRAVWDRDQGQCTFVGDGGHRCSARRRLEFDHIEPVARGGQASVENIRLRCRAHNAYEAERMFGAGFMSEKRASERALSAARKRATARTLAAGELGDSPHTRAETEARARGAESEAQTRAAEAEARARTEAKEHARDVLSGLRGLGFRSDEARRAAEFSETLPSATLEERMRAALGFLRPRAAFKTVPANQTAARA